MTTKDYTHINNMEDLRAEIKNAKAIVKLNEKELGERWKRVPKEVLKSTVGAVVPSLLNSTVAARGWSLSQKIIHFLFRKKTEEPSSTKGEILSNAKNLGLTALLTIMYKWWRKK